MVLKNKVECPFCKSLSVSDPDYERNLVFYGCPICGRFEISPASMNQFNFNHLAAYLFYHRFKDSESVEYRYHTPLDKELCDTYRAEFKQGNNRYGLPVHMDSALVENWFPKTFSERIDFILLHIDTLIPHVGQQISISYQELLSLLFIDRREIELPGCTPNQWRSDDDCTEEAEYMLEYLQSVSYIQYAGGHNEETSVFLRLTPQGYTRIDELQRNFASGRNVLVAMKFGDETKLLREAIRSGIKAAGYLAIFIDEVQHNNFITPELLKYIRDSKFVVVDLTHQNNGAYFEEGYAMGLGKPVIQLCQAETQLHFDIAQKNTIIWNTEEDIPQKLSNRIKATID